MKNIQRSRMRRKKSNRGSALLVSLMVIVGLSLLGLGFVAISETESAIAKNEQNALQTQSIAEAGAMLVVEWFQNPTWAIASAAMPSNDPSVNNKINAIKTVRVTNGYTGKYKPNANTMLLDKPYRPPAGTQDDRFWGTEDNADLIINRTTDPTTIDNFNNVLLGPNPEDKIGGEVTEIRIYAPPTTGATVVNGFLTGDFQRYGLATIKVTATEFRNRNLSDTATPPKMDPSNIVAQHAVRLVIGEIPLPIPAGPIQSNTSMAFNGDFIVHWGSEMSAGNPGTLQNKRDAQTIPWANAFEHSHFEHGYEPGTSIASAVITNQGSGYTAAQNGAAVVFAAPPAGGTQATGTIVVSSGNVTKINITNKGSGYVSVPGTATWGPAITNMPAPAGGGTTATALGVVGAEAFPITGAQFDDADYFHEILNKQFDDPWFGSRAAGDNLQDGTGPPDPANAQLYPYSYTASEGTTGSEGSHFFQWQNKNLYPWQRLVLFPKIDYTFWKKATKQSRGLKGLYYFQNDGSGNFKLNGNGTAKDPCTWANTRTNNLGPGVYFFDSLNNQNPQNGGPGTLSPGFQWNAACFNGSFLMVGFVYLNQDSYGTTGAGAAETNVPQAAFPGEPFRDVGYPKWNLALNDWDKSCGESSTGANDGNICMSGVGDASFSYQDLNSNGQLDIVTMPAPKWNSYDPGATAHAAGSTYVVKTWKSPAQAIKDYGAACTIPGTNPATDCSEPHEPYLNFIYPTSRSANITVGWEISNAQTRQPKKTSVTCSPTSPQSDCTSNSYDMDGGLVTDMNTLLDGILYNEGNYDSQGNADYFGSLLIQGTVSGNGTPDVWFDEKLLRGTWAPPGMPRVMIFSEQTDELSQQ